MKKILFVIYIMMILSGCQIFIEDKEDPLLQINPSMSEIKLSTYDLDAATALTYEMVLKNDVYVRVLGYKLEYRNTISGGNLSGYGIEEKNKGEEALGYLYKKDQSIIINWVPIVNENIRKYLETNSVVYAKVTFFIETDAGREIEKEMPVISISK